MRAHHGPRKSSPGRRPRRRGASRAARAAWCVAPRRIHSDERAETGAIAVRTTSELRALQALLLGAREDPIVLLSQSPETLQVVLDPGKVRPIVGPATGIYYLPGERLLRQLKATLGRGLALHRGASRIYWPDLSPTATPRSIRSSPSSTVRRSATHCSSLPAASSSVGRTSAAR